MAPSVDQLAAENQGRLLVAKLDTDRAPRTAQSFNIRGIPTTILFRAGKEANRLTGAVPLKALQQLAGAVERSGRRETGTGEDAETLGTLISARDASRGFSLSPSPVSRLPLPGLYSCAGSGSMVFGSTGTWISSRYLDVSMNTRMRGKAFMNAR